MALRLHQVSASTVHGMLDLIAAEHPHPALLQVQTPESRPMAGKGQADQGGQAHAADQVRAPLQAPQPDPGGT